MILGFNIGNTNTVMGIYREDDIIPQQSYRFQTVRDITVDELYLRVCDFLDIFRNERQVNAVTGIVFSSVVPEVNDQYNSMSKNLFKIPPLEINRSVRLSIKIKYDTPEQLGSDRIANAEAAFKEYGKDCIIIDLGTATTFCVLLDNGILDGGLIAPGIGITIDALANRTSKLFKVEFKKPENMVARNTVEAITSGFFYGWLSMIEGIVERIERYYDRHLLKIITGGFAEIICDHIEFENTIDKYLTMKGIKYIFDQNVK